MMLTTLYTVIQNSFNVFLSNPNSIDCKKQKPNLFQRVFLIMIFNNNNSQSNTYVVFEKSIVINLKYPKSNLRINQLLKKSYSFVYTGLNKIFLGMRSVTNKCQLIYGN